ncbi:MAG: sugar transferase [Armatimonadota bacterium]
MMLRKWDDLPDSIKNESVHRYYEVLYRKQFSLYLKRIFDITVASLSIIALTPLLIILYIAIKIDSKGPALFRQVRITQYGNKFQILKFRTMINDADKVGTLVTIMNDARITHVGKVLRKYRLDEIPQLFNIIMGDMSFVGTRPEVEKYVEQYTDVMLATLLLPAGVTSEASIKYKDEDRILNNVSNVDKIYIDRILPEKMKYNLSSIETFSLYTDIITIARTIATVVKA